MQSGADRPRPSPSSMPRQRSVPPALARRPRGLDFSRLVPPRGWHEALYLADTGVLCSIARDEVGCHQCVQHFEGRLYTTDVIVEEIKNRARRPIGPDGLLMKRAAEAALQRLIIPGKVGVVSLDEAALVAYDNAMQQLRGLAAARKAVVDEVDAVERHGGEASAIAWAQQHLASGKQLVFLTNDGDASAVAASRKIEVRHFGHVLRELVCAGGLRQAQAWNFYRRAVEVSGIPSAATFSAEDELACLGDSSGCAACGDA